MTPSLRQMLLERGCERAATAERERILSIASHGLDVGKYQRAVALAADPAMTVETATELLAAMPGEVTL